MSGRRQALRRRALAVCIAFGGGLANLPAHAQTKLTVRAVTQLGPTLPQFTMIDVPLLRDAINQAHQDRIEINLKSYPEAGVQPADALRLLRSNQFDIVAVPLATAAGDVPMLDGFDLPGAHRTIDEVRRSARALSAAANEDLERLGLQLLATAPFPAQVFFCRRAIAGLEDLRLLKIRIAGPAQTRFVEAIGAQAVSVSIGEVYSALERGTVDCAISGAGIANAQRWNEVTSHMYTLVSSFAVMGYLTNLKWWNGLAPATRTVLSDALARVETAQWEMGGVLSDDGIQCNIGNAAGCKVFTLLRSRPLRWVQPTQLDYARVREIFARIVLPEWVSRCGAHCARAYNLAVAPVSGVRFEAR